MRLKILGSIAFGLILMAILFECEATQPERKQRAAGVKAGSGRLEEVSKSSKKLAKVHYFLFFYQKDISPT